MLARTARSATQDIKNGYEYGCTGACGSGPVTARSVQQSPVRPGLAREESGCFCSRLRGHRCPFENHASWSRWPQAVTTVFRRKLPCYEGRADQCVCHRGSGHPSGDLAVERHRFPVSALGRSSTHEALGRTAVLLCLANPGGEDRQSPQLLRYDDPDGTTRSRSCMGTGDGVTSPARFSCSMSNAVGNSCRVLFACRTGALLEQTDGVGPLFREQKSIARGKAGSCQMYGKRSERMKRSGEGSGF